MRLAKAQHKAVLFSGPPRSGKDTCANIAWHWLTDKGIDAVCPEFTRLSLPLKNAVHSLFGHDMVDPEFFSSTKDDPHPDFLGMSPREAYISLAENYAKPTFGKGVFGKLLVNTMQSYVPNRYPRVFLVPDLGFTEELDAIVEYLGEDSIAVIQVTRPGTNFSKDSRRPVLLPGGMNYLVNNSGTIEELGDKLKSILEELVAEFNTKKDN